MLLTTICDSDQIKYCIECSEGISLLRIVHSPFICLMKL
jgi:hypothetical protein